MAGHLLDQEIVVLAGAAQRHGGVGLGLHARPGLRQDDVVDAAPVHLAQPDFVEVHQPRGQVGQHRWIDVLREALE